MTIKEALSIIKFAGYHGDDRTATRIYCENRIGYQRFIEALNDGRRARKAGVPCNCPQCRRELQ